MSAPIAYVATTSGVNPLLMIASEGVRHTTAAHIDEAQTKAERQKPSRAIIDRMVHSRAMSAERPPPARQLAGVALVSAALLMTELALTRIFSVIMYYHFAFLAISIALFGLSASGVFA